jgi:hypothetical protein
MCISTLRNLAPGGVELGVVYASVEGVNDESYKECVEELMHYGHKLGATALIGLWSRPSPFSNPLTQPIAFTICDS